MKRFSRHKKKFIIFLNILFLIILYLTKNDIFNIILGISIIGYPFLIILYACFGKIDKKNDYNNYGLSQTNNFDYSNFSELSQYVDKIERKTTEHTTNEYTETLYLRKEIENGK